ncbi:hypothetical protein BN1708_005696, partial [Verticillium longisporum]
HGTATAGFQGTPVWPQLLVRRTEHSVFGHAPPKRPRSTHIPKVVDSLTRAYRRCLSSTKQSHRYEVCSCEPSLPLCYHKSCRVAFRGSYVRDRHLVLLNSEKQSDVISAHLVSSDLCHISPEASDNLAVGAARQLDGPCPKSYSMPIGSVESCAHET